MTAIRAGVKRETGFAVSKNTGESSTLVRISHEVAPSAVRRRLMVRDGFLSGRTECCLTVIGPALYPDDFASPKSNEGMTVPRLRGTKGAA